MDRLDSHCQSPILLRLCIRCKGSKSRANFLKDLNCLTKTASAQKYFSTFSMQLHLFNSLKRGSLNHIGEPFAPATMRALAARTLPTVHLSSLILTETLTRPNICVLFFSFLFLCAVLSFRQSWGHWQQQKRTGQSTRKCTTTVHCWHTSQLSGIQQKLWRQWHSR